MSETSFRSGSAAGVRVYVAAVVVLATAAAWIAVEIEPAVGPETYVTVAGVFAFVVVGLGLELAGHRLAAGNAGGSLGFIVFLGGVLVFGPAWGACITCLSIGAAQTLRRTPRIRIVFNVAQHGFALLAGAAAYGSLGGAFPPQSVASAAVPYVAFVVTFFLINSSAVSGAIAIHDRRPFLDVWIPNTLNLATYDLVASTFGLATALVYTDYGFIGMAGLVILILIVRHIYGINIRLQDTNRELLDLMVKAIEARDPYTSGHSQRVSELARTIAKNLHLGFKEVENIGTAALLHDVGKIYEEFAPILRKEGKLTLEEKRTMESHPVRSAELVGTISSLRGYVYRCVRHHHESFDGSGYPDRLRGSQIPMGARIIMVADTVDAMTTDRPYRQALPFERVCEELDKHRGRQFDPTVVRAFVNGPAVRRLMQRHLATPSGTKYQKQLPATVS